MIDVSRSVCGLSYKLVVCIACAVVAPALVSNYPGALMMCFVAKICKEINGDAQ